MAQRLLTARPSALGRAGRAVLRQVGLHPHDRQARALDLRGTRALCVATNHGVLDLGVATGVFASEITVPYYCFLDAGMHVDVASPQGGIVPVDPLSMREELRTAEDDRLVGDARFRRQLTESLAVADLDFAAYDIVYFAGGWGAAFDLGQLGADFVLGGIQGGIDHVARILLAKLLEQAQIARERLPERVAPAKRPAGAGPPTAVASSRSSRSPTCRAARASRCT